VGFKSKRDQRKRAFQTVKMEEGKVETKARNHSRLA
jgi:hypothetical protein